MVQYSSSADLNLGVGMVVMGLASLIIGQTLFGRGGVARSAAAVVGGSLVYRIIFAAALELRVPAAYMKLLTALIVALAIAMPTMKQKLLIYRRRRLADRKERG